MNPTHRGELLREVMESLHPNLDENGDPLQTFLPLRMHEAMLDDAILVVEGERGAGKTALFRFLSALREREVSLRSVFLRAPAEPWAWLTGFEERGTDHPSRQVLTAWGANQTDAALEYFWLGHLVARLSSMEELPAPPDVRFLVDWRMSPSAVGTWAPQVAEDLEPIYGWLDRVQQHLARTKTSLMIGYDELDRLTADGHLDLPGRYSSTLIRLWLGLRRRLSRLRAKIFLRPDVFLRGKTATVDASKLDGHVVSLKWTSEDIFRVLLRRLMRGAKVREWLVLHDPRLWSEPHDLLGLLPPLTLPELPELPPEQLSIPLVSQVGPVNLEAGEPTQESVVALLAGTHMGKGPMKGRTHRWILNHSSDGLRRVLPRVTLNLVRNATQRALDRAIPHPGDTLLLPSDLVAAQIEAGQQRLAEVRESHPVVWRMEHLRGQLVPLDLSVAHEALALPHPDHPDDGVDGAGAFTTLVGLGVMLRREPAKGQSQPRADVPDLFRRPLEIKRRGGPLQIKQQR